MDIAAYVPGRETVEGVAKVWKLSSNETPLGPSPKAREAIAAVTDRLEIYPDGDARKLRDAIAEVHGLNPANIICSNGSDELLGLLAHTYLQPGDEGIITEHGFLVYKIQIMAAGGVPVVVKEKNETVDVDAILAAVTDKTRLVYLANPANPTGTYIPAEEVRRLHAGLPKNVLLVIDAAYAEYVRKNDYEAGLELVSSWDNVVMTRTFSKIHGLAGLRVGYAVSSPEAADLMNRAREPFNVNSLAQAAAVTALADAGYVTESRALNRQGMTALTAGLEQLGLPYIPSVGNFVTFEVPARLGADAAYQALLRQGVIVRPVPEYGLPAHLRVTVGLPEENQRFLEALQRVLG